MKTPRQILFEQHASADRELERIQSEVLRRMLQPAPQPRENSDCFLPIYFLSKLWKEVFMPARRIWAGFAFTWLIILTINVSDTNPLPKQASSKPLSATILMAWKEQQQIVNELTGPTAMQSADRPKRTVPQPRSECHKACLIG